jgi:hypothetical protein
MPNPSVSKPKLSTPAIADDGSSLWRQAIDITIALIWAACGVCAIVVFASLRGGFLTKGDELFSLRPALLIGIMRLLVAFILAFSMDRLLRICR